MLGIGLCGLAFGLPTRQLGGELLDTLLVELPFTLQVRESPEGQAALMEGVITLNRLDFGIGQGQWQSTETIGNEVKISITVVADSR